MERYSRDTVVVTTAELNELAANKALDPTVEYWVDRAKFANALNKETIQYQGSGEGGGSAVPLTITGVNQVGSDLTAVPAAGWVFTTGQWYLDGEPVSNQTTLTLRQLSTAIGKAYGFQPTGVPYRATAAVTAGGSVALAISGTPQTTAAVGTPYNFTPTVVGGTGTKVFSLYSGSVPAGLSFSTSTGAITGTPTAAATSANIGIRVTDSFNVPADLPAFSIAVSSASGAVQTIAPADLTASTGSAPASTLGGQASRTLIDGSTNGVQGTLRIPAGERWEVHALIGGSTSDAVNAAFLFVGQVLFTDGNPTGSSPSSDRLIRLAFPTANTVEKHYIGSVEGRADGYAVPRISRQGTHAEDTYTGIVHILGFEYRKIPDVVQATVAAPVALAMTTYPTPTLNGRRYNCQMAGVPMITSDANTIIVGEPVNLGSNNLSQYVSINAATRGQLKIGQMYNAVGPHDDKVPGHNSTSVAIDSAGNLVFTANGHSQPLTARYAPALDISVSVAIPTPATSDVNSSYRKFYKNPYNNELWLAHRTNATGGDIYNWDVTNKVFNQKIAGSAFLGHFVRPDNDGQGGTYGGQIGFASATKFYVSTSWIKWGLGAASGYPQRNTSMVYTEDNGLTFKTMMGRPISLPMTEGHEQLVAFPSADSKQNVTISALVFGPDNIPIMFATYQHHARAFREMWMAKWNPTTQVFDRKMLYASRGDFSVGQGDGTYDIVSGRIVLIFSEVEDFSASGNTAVIPPAYPDCNMICLYSDDSGATFQRRVLGSAANWSGGVIDVDAFRRTGGKLLRMALRNHSLGTTESNYYEATLP